MRPSLRQTYTDCDLPFRHIARRKVDVSQSIDHVVVNDRAPKFAILAAAVLITLAGCGTTPVAKIDSHLRNAGESRTPPVSTVPAPVRQVPIPPPPVASPEEKRYSVTVIDVPARDILLAMQRDTGINIDIYPGIEGRVTLNAIDQTLKQILTRMSKQIDMRWELDGPNIAVMKDRPYLKTYIVDYVNVGRDSTSTVGVQTQVVGPNVRGSQGSGGAGGASENTSTLKIENTARNRFWETLKLNINEILADEEKLINKSRAIRTLAANSEQSSANDVSASGSGAASGTGAAPSGRRGAGVSGAGDQSVQGTAAAQQAFSGTSTATVGDVKDAATVIMNPETGTISVRASSRFHEKIGQFIETVATAAKRQVLIEVTVAEVVLDDGYQSGIDWSAIGLQGLGYTIRQNLTRSNPTPTGTTLNDNFFSIAYANPNAAAGGNVSSTLKLLSSYGSTKVLSSPRTTTLNNQTAVMKVVENKVYFTVSVTPPTRNESTGATLSPATYTTTPNIVPEGFVMSVTPQIGENDVVNLSIRPTITRIVDYVNDPNPDLKSTTPNRIPQVQTREFETMLRIPSGQTAILGGLMQDSFIAKRDGLPGLSRIPLFGDAVSYRNDAGRKSELVIFIRPIVIKDASIETDLRDYKRYLPDGNFFKEAEPAVNIPIPGIPAPVQPKP